MTKKDDIKAEKNHHTRWAEEIRKRNDRYSEDSNCFFFVQNIEDVLERINEVSQRFDDLENEIEKVKSNIIKVKLDFLFNYNKFGKFLLHPI